MFARQNVLPNLNYFSVLPCSAIMATWLLLFSSFIRCFFCVSELLVSSSDFCLKESKSQALLSERMVIIVSVFCREIPITGTGYFTDTVFQIKRNPYLRNLCRSRVMDTPYDSCKMFSGGWKTMSMWWESNENSHSRSISGLLWARSKFHFNFVNTEVGHFLDTCTAVNSISC